MVIINNSHQVFIKSILVSYISFLRVTIFVCKYHIVLKKISLKFTVCLKIIAPLKRFLKLY